MSRKELKPEDVTAVIDTREQRPWSLPFAIEAGTLPTGDYSIRGLERHICVERKSLEDLVGCVGRERERFEKEIQRMLAYESRLVVVEAPWNQLEAGGWRGKVQPAHVCAAVVGWMARGVPFFFARREQCEAWAARFMFIAARRRARDAQAFWSGLKVG